MWVKGSDLSIHPAVVAVRLGELAGGRRQWSDRSLAELDAHLLRDAGFDLDRPAAPRQQTRAGTAAAARGGWRRWWDRMHWPTRLQYPVRDRLA